MEPSDYSIKMAARASRRPASGKMLLRVPPELHAAALREAELSGKSLNQWAADTLQQAISH